ncbi:MAG: EF-hand domain-containing protein [Akkermansia sp.]
MKKSILTSIAVAFLAVPAFAQGPDIVPNDAPSPPSNSCNPCDCKCHGEREGGYHHGNRPHRKMNPEKRGMAILGEALIMEKYDVNKDGTLNEEEIVVLREDAKKQHQAKRAEMLKKFDKDGDGTLSKEEKQTMRDEWKKEHPEIVEKMKAAKAKMMEKFDKDGDGTLSDEEKDAKKAQRKAKRGNRHGHDKDRGHRKQPVPRMAVGLALLQQKYDTDQDGKLSDAEKEAMKADAQKALEAKKAARQAAKALNKAKDNDSDKDTDKD